MLQCNFEKCTGCGACVQICPKSCVNMKEDSEGFLYPHIDIQECIDCGRCESVCPIGCSVSVVSDQTAYAAVSVSANDLRSSTSGGAFSAIAKYVYNRGGSVYGCAYSEDMMAIHKRTTSKEELAHLNGSKYVQSNTLETYVEAKRDLKQGKIVLYSGTPCQIAGLYSFLGENPENLITIDLVCHGVPSPGYFRKFVNWLSARENAKIVDVNFRNKKNSGWSLAGTYSMQKRGNQKVLHRKLYYFTHYYYGYFLSGDVYRTSCYECQFANMNRCADFTLGDLWGAAGMDIRFPISSGCSLLLVNTEKAMSIFKCLELKLQEIPTEIPKRTNKQLVSPSERSSLREVLYKEYRECSAEQIQRNFVMRRKKQIIIGRIKSCIPSRVKSTILQIKYKTKEKSNGEVPETEKRAGEK